MMLQLRLAQLQRCRSCGTHIDSERVREAQIHLRLFGLVAGWRVCRCGQTITRKERHVITDRRGTARPIYRRVYRDIA